MSNQPKELVWIIIPLPLLAAALIGYVAVAYIFDSFALADPEKIETLTTFAQVSNLVLGILGILALVSIPLGIGFGMYHLTKPDEEG